MGEWEGSTPMGVPAEPDDSRSLILPADLHYTSQPPSPIMCIDIGRRGVGKTYAMSAFARFMRARFDAARTASKIAANYSLDFADVRSQYLLDEIIDFPPWLQDIYLCIDEIQTAALSRRSMSTGNVALGQFLTEMRKRAIDGRATTQFPQVLDQMLLMQIDIVAWVTTHYDMRLVVFHCIDFWGQFTGEFVNRKMPPPVTDTQWEVRLWIPDPKVIFDSYDTFEVIGSMYMNKDRRRELIARETEGKGREHLLPSDSSLDRSPWVSSAPAGEGQGQSPTLDIKVRSDDPLYSDIEGYYSIMPDKFPLRAFRKECAVLRKGMDKDEVGEWLKRAGATIEREGFVDLVVKPSRNP